MRFEKFVGNKKPGLRFGFIGIGQCGGKIVDVLAGIRNQNNDMVYSDILAVNSFIGDLEALKKVPSANRFLLKGYEKGCARNPRKGAEAVQENGEELFNKIQIVMNESDYIWVVAGLGGGTGTGAIGLTIDALSYLGKPVGAIITLPRSSDSLEEKANALDALRDLEQKLKDKSLSTLLIIDNDKLYNDYLIERENNNISLGLDWMTDSNQKVAQILHEINVATNQPSEKTFDAGELEKILTGGGCLTIAKVKFLAQDIKHEQDLVNLIEKTLTEKNIFATNFDFNRARYCGVSIVKWSHNKMFGDIKTFDIIEKIIKKEMPHLIGYYSGYVNHDQDGYINMYIIVGGLPLPHRAYHLDEEISQQMLYLEREREKESNLKFNNSFGISNISDNVRNVKPKEQVKNPFRRTASETVLETNKPANPFLKVRKADF